MYTTFLLLIVGFNIHVPIEINTGQLENKAIRICSRNSSHCGTTIDELPAENKDALYIYNVFI